VPGIETVKSPRLRLHVRAMVRDRKLAFVGSQSLRRPQIDGRREIGVIAPNEKIAATLARVFDQDWSDAVVKPEPKEKAREVAEEVAV
jgi:phosphatidylserine/phosphatidylglycerophosphate/cardiolipin synthase-like enzyme